MASTADILVAPEGRCLRQLDRSCANAACSLLSGGCDKVGGIAYWLWASPKTRYSSLAVLARKSDSKIASTGKTQVAPACCHQLLFEIGELTFVADARVHQFTESSS
jgi:hypothetical protein